ncbi:MAG: MATE family efflux transporter [Ruminococcaceae bacterium]|nr:MATE family efflux transporter [Oscillospiraceae bacterium]
MTKKHSYAKELVLFCLPLILSGILQQLYSWADAFIVGHAEGELQLAAIGATNSISTFLLNTILGLTLGLSIMAAQEYGKGNIGKLKKILYAYLPVISAVYIVFSVIIMIFAEDILIFMHTPKEILEYSRIYLQTVLIGVLFLWIYNLFAALFRAKGDTKVAFFAVLISSLLNVALDILFVAVLPYGVGGAAFATVLSQFSMTVFIIIYGFFKHKDIISKNVKFDLNVLKEGVSFAMPPALQNSVISAGNLVLQNFMNSFGAVTVLAITTSYRVDSLMLLPIINLGSAIATMVARSKGEKNLQKQRAYIKSGLLVMAAVTGALTVLVFLCGGLFVSFFGVSGDALAEGYQFFRDLSLFYMFFGMATALRSALEGMGDLKYCSFAGVATLVVRIAFSYILKPYCKNRTIAFAEAVAGSYFLCLCL